VAIGALFGVKLFRRNAEHVVTLDANTMQNRLTWRRSFQFRSMRLRLGSFISHGEILAQQRETQHYWRAQG
jgi:hypothetical protein